MEEKAVIQPLPLIVGAVQSQFFKIRMLRSNTENDDGGPILTATEEGHGSHGDNYIRVYMNGAVGDDAFGAKLKGNLEHMGIDVSGIATIGKEVSGTCSVIVQGKHGESRNLAYQGANRRWAFRENASVEGFAGGISKPDLIISHLGIRREEVEKVLEVAGKRGVDTVLNPSPAVYLLSSMYKNVTHLIVNEFEAALLTATELEALNDEASWQKAAKEFMDHGVENVVITLGARGAYYITKDGDEGHEDAEKVDVVDSTGAGFVANHLS